MATSTSASGSTTSVPSSANSSWTCASRAASWGGPSRLHDGALAHLDGERGDEAVDGPIGVGGAQRCERRGGEDRGDRARVGAISAATSRELSGLVAEHEQIRALGHLGVALQRLPSDLRGKRGGTLGQRVRAEHGAPPPARERAGHVACADETYLHGFLVTSISSLAQLRP